MRSCLFSLACCGVLSLLLDGCAMHPSPRSVAQKPAANQTPTYTPYYQAPSTAPPPNLVVAPPAVVAPQGKIIAAILLPLSGQNAALGQAMLNAAQQAVFDAGGNNFALQPHDTAAAGGAAAAAKAAVSGGAQLIIGPLFAADIPQAETAALSSGLPMLALSTDTTLAERGLYVMGLAPEGQVQRVVSFSAAHGARRFAALVPATPYGNLVGHSFQTAVAQYGGSLVEYESYDPAAHDLDDRIKILAEQRPQIDALFLPESDADLKLIADKLTAAGFTAAQTHILGTGLWDAAALGRQSPLLLGAWYAAPDPATRRTFNANYMAAYGQEPPRLATLAYDATALAAVIAKHGNHFTEAALTNPNGFAGLDGIFRLTTQGQVERALAVLEITPEGSRILSPAPTNFIAPR